MQIRTRELAYIPQSRPLKRVPIEGHTISWEAPPAQTRWSDALVRRMRDLPAEKMEVGGALVALAGAGLAAGLGLEGHTGAALVSAGVAGLGALSVAAARGMESALSELQKRSAHNLQTSLRRSQVQHEASRVLQASNQPVNHYRFAKAEVLQAGEQMLLSFPATGRWVVVNPAQADRVCQYQSDGSSVPQGWTSEYTHGRYCLDATSGQLTSRSLDGSREARVDLNTGAAELCGPGYQTRIDENGRVHNPPRPVLDELVYAPAGLVSLRKPETGHYHLEPVPFDLESFGYRVHLES